MFKFTKESNSDSFEYKKHILTMDNKKFERYATQIHYRILIGKGQCYYLIGVSDNGDINGLKSWELITSLFNLLKIANTLNVYPDNIKTIFIKEINSFILIVKLISMNEIYTNPLFITLSSSDSDCD